MKNKQNMLALWVLLAALGAPALADDWDYSRQLGNFENQMRWALEEE